jgi:hypothetical protein
VITVDSYEFTSLPDTLTADKVKEGGPDTNDPVEFKPHFHEWATVQPGTYRRAFKRALLATKVHLFTDASATFAGMICLARKKRTAVFRQYVAAETAVPVIACAACLDHADEKNYFFAGVARSKSVRDPDDGIGPKTDEFFTVSIGGMVTVLNTSGEPIHPVSTCLNAVTPYFLVSLTHAFFLATG